MTRTDSAKLGARNYIFNGLAPICVAFARALPGLVRADSGKGSRS